MNFLLSNEDEDDNFDFFITQNLKVTPQRVEASLPLKKKPLIPTPPIALTGYTPSPSVYLKPQQALQPSRNWRLFAEFMNLEEDELLQKSHIKHQNLVSVQQGVYDNKRIPQLVCEIVNLEAFGETSSCQLRDFTGETCAASILTEVLTLDFNEEQALEVRQYPKQLYKRDCIIVILENVIVFAPSVYQRSIIIEAMNIKYAFF